MLEADCNSYTHYFASEVEIHQKFKPPQKLSAGPSVSEITIITPNGRKKQNILILIGAVVIRYPRKLVNTLLTTMNSGLDLSYAVRRVA